MQQYEWLLSKLDAFIRKFYVNQLIRGVLILLICLLFYILAASVSEYFLYLPVPLKVTIVGLFAVLGLGALVFWIAFPLARMARLGNTLSHEQAAAIIGRHFPEISDKLLNILQLKKQPDREGSRELIEASINQKAGQISVVPITRAIDLTRNRRFLPFLLPLVLAGVFILVAAPNVFRDASERLLQPTRSFERPAPFRFTVLTQPLVTVRNGDFVVKAKVTGSALPAALMVELNGESMPMTPLDNHIFQYTFRNVTEPVKFRLSGAGFYSETYTLKVTQKPVLKAIRVTIDYPDYTGRKDEMRASLGDMTLPAGTRVAWAFLTQYTDGARLHWAHGSTVSLPGRSGMFGYQHQFLQDTAYTISLSNRQSPVIDSFSYNVQVIPDQYPILQVQEFRDTVSGKQIVLTGTAGDDYGITRVLFHYNVTNDKGQPVSAKAIPLRSGGGALTSFQQYFDIQSLNLQPGQKVTYFVEAWDNDGVHGSKASRSELMTYQMYTPKQLDSAMSVNSKQISSGLSNSAQQTKQLQQEIKDMQSKMLQSDEMNFEQQQNLQDLAQKQEDLKSQMEQTKKRFEEQQQQSLQKEYSQDIKDKQEELSKQLDNLLNKELREQMKKLQELMQKLNKEQAFQTMQQMEEQNKLFNMDLQRMQELMKQLEMQMRMEDLANKMDKLAKDQLGLKEKTEDKKGDNQSLGKEQQDLKKELQKAMNDDMKQLQQLSDKAQQKQDMQQSTDQGKQAEQNMQQSEQQLGQNQNGKSGESQSKAAQNLQQMASQLRMQAGGMNMEQIDMDIKAVRQILTNLMRLSFDQEKLMNGVRQTPITSGVFLTNQTEQNRLYGNSHMIRDSLFVLSKRLFKLSASVNKETTELEGNMNKATTALEERKVGDALVRQQYVMTHTNNLALMLNEILGNLMQQKMQSQSMQSGSCSKPGGSKPKPGSGQQLSDIISQQQQLGNSMQQMQGPKPGKSGQGQKPGGGKPGSGGGAGSEEGSQEYGNSEQLARMANQQAAIRRQLQDLQSRLNGKGTGAAKELREIQDQMDRNESDLVNKRLSGEFLMRQREIMTRLLEAEKSLREQDQDDKRSSNTARELSRPVPAELQQYLQARQNMLDLYRTVPPQLKPYYKGMVEQYFKSIGNK